MIRSRPSHKLLDTKPIFFDSHIGTYVVCTSRQGKQYTFGKGPEYDSETAKLQAENWYLKQQIEVLKKY